MRSSGQSDEGLVGRETISVEFARARDGFGYANHVAHGRDVVNPNRVRAIQDRHGHGRGCAEDPFGR